MLRIKQDAIIVTQQKTVLCICKSLYELFYFFQLNFIVVFLFIWHNQNNSYILYLPIMDHVLALGSVSSNS